MLTLHQFEISPFAVKIRRLMNYKGLSYSTNNLPLVAQGEIKKRSPSGKLPCLEHDGKLIQDSTDIAYYLEQQFPDKTVIPDDPALAALVHIIEDWADESLYFYEMRLRFMVGDNVKTTLPKLLAEDKGIVKWLLAKVIPSGMKKILNNQGVGRKPEQQLFIDIERHLKAISDLLHNQEWLVGNQLTLADLAVFSMVECFNDTKEAKQRVAQYPKILAWYQRVDQQTQNNDT